MAKRTVLLGSTDQTIDIFIQDSSSSVGAGLTGLVFNSSGLTCYFREGATATPAALTLATQTVGGAHSDGGFVAVDGTNMPGVYRLDLSDTIISGTNPYVILMLKGATNMAPVNIEIELVAYNPFDGVRLGLTSLPNAVADGAGGLPISDAGGLDLDQIGIDTAATIVDTADMQPKVAKIPLSDGVITWNATALASINAECDTALTDYDGPTNAEMVARTLLAADYFDPAADDVATVTTCTTNTDMRGTDSALLAASAPTNFGDLSISVTTGLVDITQTAADKSWATAARTVTAATNITSDASAITMSSSGVVGTVNLTNTTTTNTDMRGTDSALLAASAPTNFGDLSISVTTGLVDITQTAADKSWATAARTVTAATNITSDASAITMSSSGVVGVVNLVNTTTTNTDAITVASILTTAMTESYAADGSPPTLTQSLMLIQQHLTEFSIGGTTWTTKRLNGSTTAATFTLDDGTSPTSITRTT